MQKIIIAHVYYTQTDETFYVLNRLMENAEQYIGSTLQETLANLKAAGWSTCGKVQRHDGVPVDMMSDADQHFIALWAESNT